MTYPKSSSGEQVKKTLAAIWRKATNLLECTNLVWNPDEYECVLCRDGVMNWIPETTEEDKVDPLGDTRLYSILYRLSQMEFQHSQLSRSIFHFIHELREEEAALNKEFSIKAREIIKNCRDDEAILEHSFHQTNQPEMDTDTYFKLRYIQRF